jgi:hypothetical protein
MSRLSTNKIVASVVCRPDNQVARRKRLKSAIENRRREVRAVAIEGNDAMPTGRREMCKNGDQSCGQATTLPAPLCPLKGSDIARPLQEKEGSQEDES